MLFIVHPSYADLGRVVHHAPIIPSIPFPAISSRRLPVSLCQITLIDMLVSYPFGVKRRVQ